MRNISDEVVDKMRTHIFVQRMLLNHAVYDIIWKNLYSRTGHRWQYGAGALLAKYL